MIEEIKRQKDSINLVMAKEKGLIDAEDYNLYEKIESIYRKGLYQLLYSHTDLKKYDDVIASANLDFGEIPEERKNPYQKASNMKYLYIRNFLYVEKLSKEDIEVLENKEEVDEEVIHIVSKTFREVICNNYRKGEYREECTTCYGPVIPSNIVDSKNLVVAFHYGKNENIVDGPEFIQNLKAQKFFIKEFSKRLEEKMRESMLVDVTVLEKTYVNYL